VIDRDAGLGEALERLTPPLAAYELDWEEVLERAAAHRSHFGPMTSRRRGTVLAVIVAAVVAIALTVTTPWSGGPGIVELARAALTLPPGSVLHIEWEDTSPIDNNTTEAWIESRGRFHGFVTDTSTGQRVEVGGTRDLGQSVSYDPATNAIGAFLAGPLRAVSDDVAVLRKHLAEGTATAAGDTKIGGRAVKRIRLQLGGADCKPTVHYLFVDPRTYEPVEYRLIVFAARRSSPAPNAAASYRRVPLVRRFLTYDRLPATPANLRLTDIRAAHPTAKVYPPPPFKVGGPSCAGSP
jgi:hypothetical protein